MKKLHSLLIILSLLVFSHLSVLKAQPVKTMVESVINGAGTGAAVSTAAWLVENDGNPILFDEIAFGLGAGILGGIGSGLLDVIQSEGKPDYAVQGTFNVSRNRAGLVVMDTFYGAGAGLILSGAFTLMSDNKSLSNLSEGIGVGAWFGFGFGLVDAFILSKQTKVRNSRTLVYQQTHRDERLKFLIAQPEVMPSALQAFGNAKSLYVNYAKIKFSF